MNWKNKRYYINRIKFYVQAIALVAGCIAFALLCLYIHNKM